MKTIYELVTNRDVRPPRNGWAKGFYSRNCHMCHEAFVGDKRAITCAECAYTEPKVTALKFIVTIFTELFRPSRKCDRLGCKRVSKKHIIRKASPSKDAIFTDYTATFDCCKRCDKLVGPIDTPKFHADIKIGNMPQNMLDAIAKHGYFIIR
jgi:hypothetical protein